MANIVIIILIILFVIVLSGVKLSTFVTRTSHTPTHNNHNNIYIHLAHWRHFISPPQIMLLPNISESINIADYFLLWWSNGSKVTWGVAACRYESQWRIWKLWSKPSFPLCIVKLWKSNSFSWGVWESVFWSPWVWHSDVNVWWWLLSVTRCQEMTQYDSMWCVLLICHQYDKYYTHFHIKSNHDSQIFSPFTLYLNVIAIYIFYRHFLPSNYTKQILLRFIQMWNSFLKENVKHKLEPY